MATQRGLKHSRPKIEEETSFFSSSLSFLSSVTGQAEPVKEIDPQFDEFSGYVTGLNDQVATLQVKVTTNITKKRELKTTLEEFSHSAGLVGASETTQDTILAGFWHKLSDILKMMAELNELLATSETNVFDNTLKDYVRLTAAGKIMLSNRLELLEKLQQAKAKNSDNVPALEKEFKEVSQNIKDELEAFKKQKTSEFRNSLRGLVKANVEHQQKVVALWKELLSELEEHSTL